MSNKRISRDAQLGSISVSNVNHLHSADVLRSACAQALVSKAEAAALEAAAALAVAASLVRTLPKFLSPYLPAMLEHTLNPLVRQPAAPLKRISRAACGCAVAHMRSECALVQWLMHGCCDNMQLHDSSGNTHQHSHDPL